MEGDGQVTVMKAYSGTDGRRIWDSDALKWSGGSGSISSPMWSYEYPFLDAADLDGDGRVEVMSVRHQSGQPLVWSAVSGRTGRLLWEAPIIQGGWFPKPSSSPRPLADLNGDGRLDVVLWRPEGDGSGRGQPCRLAAYDGRNGEILWTTQPPRVTNDSQIIWPEPAVGDLDGDGIGEVVVAVHQPFDATHGYACDVVALDGRSGAVRWSWRWQSGFPELWPPVVLPGKDGRSSVVVGVREKEDFELVNLSHDGQVRTTVPLKDPRRQYFSAGLLVWRAADTDGDGRAELVYIREGRLVVARGDGLATAWEWNLPSPKADLVSVHRPGPDQPVEMVVWTGKTVFGLAGVDGALRWRGEALTEPQSGMSSAPQLIVLPDANPGGLPWVQLRWPKQSSSRQTTVCRQTWAVDSTGRYMRPSP
jgi:outer membrane protein assembly factor BamB